MLPIFSRHAVTVAALALVCTPVLVWSHADQGRNTLSPPGYNHYLPTPVPDRIILTVTEEPATSVAVSWRTDTSLEQAVVQVAPVLDGPALLLETRTVPARTVLLRGENGVAHHHSAIIRHLEPDTLYAYRVQGGGTWSEWFQFRTAADTPRTFSFIYFGDAQNAVKSHFSRVLRQAFRNLPDAAFMVHAGDLVNQRGDNHDDEWGEWFDSGGWLFGMIPSILAAGNHEFTKHVQADEDEVYLRHPMWDAQFRLPENGPDGLKETVYYLDYQGVRFIILDSTSAINDGTASLQARWLEQVLRDNPNRWTIAVYHHPMFSVSQGRDNPVLREYWQPLFERYGVDLALQGHDHVYGRGANLGEGTHSFDDRVGTMYVVSVAGPKMYMVSDQARLDMTRVAEDTQLYQIIQVRDDRLIFEARTPSGRLYDGFQLIKSREGHNRLEEVIPEERRCTRPEIPGYRDSRCWEGTDLIELPSALQP